MNPRAPGTKAKKARLHTYTGVVCSWAGGLIAILCVIYFPVAVFSRIWPLSLLYLAGAAFGSWLFRAGRRLSQESASIRLSEDHRPPVLLLRAFGADGRIAEKSYLKQRSLIGWILGRASFEEQLANIMEDLGPTVALGRQGEILPTFGFARQYVGNSEWRDVLASYLDRSAWAVFLLYEITPNLTYEVSLVVRSRPKLRVLLVPPPNEYRTPVWFERYRALAQQVTALPEIKPDTAAVIFDPREGMTAIPMGDELSSNAASGSRMGRGAGEELFLRKFSLAEARLPTRS